MKKRIKIISLITSLCICLSLFTVGVFAVTQVSFGVTSSMSFTADGVYVKAEGNLKQGTSASSATVQAEPEGANYTYVGYSYTRLGSGTDPDVPDGSASVTNLVDASGAPNATWAIGDINFSNTLPVVVYEFTFTNYSEVDVEANITVTQGTGLQTLVAQNKVKITQGLSTVSMAKYDGTITSSQKATYKIVVELLSYTTSFPANTELSVNVNFEQGEYVEILDASAYPMLSFASNGDGTASVSSGTTTPAGSLVIPSYVLVDGEPCIVTEISASAFTFCTDITSVNIPDTIEKIGYNAFGFCEFSNVKLPSSLTSLSCNVFNYSIGMSIDMTSVNWENITSKIILVDGPFGSTEVTTITVANGEIDLAAEKIEPRFSLSLFRLTDGSITYTWSNSAWG